MSTKHAIGQTPIDKFTTIFNAAPNEYRKVTGYHLTHPFATQLGACDNPGVHIGGTFDENLVKLLDLTVDIFIHSFIKCSWRGLGWYVA
jgi:hypothetical protein